MNDPWHLQTRVLTPRKVLQYTLQEGGAPLSVAEVLQHWQTGGDFVAWWCDALAAADFQAFFWEMPSLRAETLDQPFTCVVVDSPALAQVYADQEPFARQFARGAGQLVVTFDNLGGDARLVVPTPRQGKLAYPHLAAFLRRAAIDQQFALWRELSLAVQDSLGKQPLWISTSGLGVHWLHLRLDQRPKYYQHAPFRHS